MTGTKKSAMTKSAMTKNVDGVIGARVVCKGNDGIWLNLNPPRHGGVRGGSAQHVRGVTGRPARWTGPIGTWEVGGRRCEVRRLKAPNGRFDVAVMNADGVRPFLLSARGNLHGGFGHGGLSVHVHAPLVERLGEKDAVTSARRWANQLMLCLPTPRDVIGCERVSRIDYAVDVLVAKGGPDDYGPAVHEQLVSRLRHPKAAWDTGWEIGRGDTDKDRLERVITSYDKLQERRDKGGVAGLREYVTSLGDPSLGVDDDGRVTLVDDSNGKREVRVWRVEFRFHRAFLQGKGISDADEGVAALPALVAAACQTTRLNKRCSTGNVFPTSPMTPLWNSVRQTVM